MMKKGALSLDNRQNIVDNEALMDRLGKSGVFSMYKGAVTNQGRLGETQESPELSESDKRLQEDNGVQRFTQARDMGICIARGT